MKRSSGASRPKTSLRLGNIIMMSLIVLVCILLAVNTMQISKYNKQSLELSEAHIVYSDIAMQLNLGSDILTEQVRGFAETGDIQHLNGYFEEANVARHRNLALDELNQLTWIHTTASEDEWTATTEKIKRALRESNQLMTTEFYSMRLTAKGYGIDVDTLPAEVKNVELSRKDDSLSAEEAKRVARALLFDNEYISAKGRIKQFTSDFLDKMIDLSRSEYQSIKGRLSDNLTWQSVFIVLLVIVVIVITAFMHRFIIKPLIKASKNIKSGAALELPGQIEEMKALNDSYNTLRENNAELMGQLSLLANRDALTGIGSRAAYNEFIVKVNDGHGRLFMFLFDVNNLRKMNNEQGHEKGDALLVGSAKSIKAVFGIYDYENCFRIGGDEFVAFIKNEPEENAEGYIKAFKEETARRGVSVAVGYSYVEDVFRASMVAMYKDADAKMYIAKNNEKNKS